MKKHVNFLSLCLVSFFIFQMNMRSLSQEITPVGTFSMSATVSVHYFKHGTEVDSIVSGKRVDSIKFTIIDGSIRYVKVFTELGNYINGQTSISISHYNDVNSENYLIETQNRVKGHYIVLEEVLFYEPEHNGFVFPDDGNYKLRNKTHNTNFEAAASVGKASGYGIDLKGFTDAGALFGNKPNGLVTLEGTGRILMNNVPIANTPAFLVQYFDLYGGYSKFDSKFANTLVPADGVINRIDNFQKARTSLGFDLSLIRLYLPENMELNLCSGAQWNIASLSPASDTSIKSSSSIYSWITQLDFSFSTGSLFHVKLSPAILYQGIDFNTDEIKIANADNIYVFRAKALFSINTSKSNNNSKIFFRINYYKQIDYRGANGKGGDFTQFQIGYEKNFGDLFKTNVQAEDNKNKR